MAAMLRSGGLLVLTSRSWELVRDQGSGLRIGDRLVERDGRRRQVVHSWILAEDWNDAHARRIARGLSDCRFRLPALLSHNDP
jgi:hypothetical protein